MQGTVLIFCCFAINDVFVLWIYGYVAIRHFWESTCVIPEILEKLLTRRSVRYQHRNKKLQLSFHWSSMRFGVDWHFHEILIKKCLCPPFNKEIFDPPLTFIVYLQKINPYAVLPNERIVVIARSDKSGTTEAFTRSLAYFRYQIHNLNFKWIWKNSLGLLLWNLKFNLKF